MVWAGKQPILAVANVGDCRAVLVQSDGNFEPLSIDHKPNLKSERERIESLGGKVTQEPYPCWSFITSLFLSPFLFSLIFYLRTSLLIFNIIYLFIYLFYLMKIETTSAE